MTATSAPARPATPAPMRPRASRSLAGRVGVALVGNVMPPLAAFFTAPLLAQVLGADGRGEVSAATAPLMLMLGAATLGLPEAVTYFVAAGLGRLRRTLLTASAWIAGAGVAATILVAALAPFLGAGQGDITGLIVLAALAIVPSLLVGVVRGAAAGLGAWGCVTADRVVQSLFRLVVLAGLALAGALTTTTATVTIALAGLVGAVAYLPLLRARHTLQEGPADGLLSYGMRNWSGSLSGILVSRLDQALMVPLCSSTAQLGLYAVAVSISELPLVVNQAVRDVTFAAESQGPDADRLARATRLSTALTGAAAAAVGVLSVLFLTTLFGHDFAGAVVVTLVLLVAVVGGNPGSVAGMGLSARGRPGLRSLSLSLALVVDVVALVLLVPVLGAMGAALATLVANCTCAALNLYWLRRVFGLPVGSFLGLRRSDLTGATALVRRRMIRSAAR